MTPSTGGRARPPRLAILSYSSGEYDARSFRLARSAIAAGYEVTMYARWHPGQPRIEELEGYRLIRADFEWRLAVPLLQRGAAKRSAARIAAAADVQTGRPDSGGSQEPEAAVSQFAGARSQGWRQSPLLLPARLAKRLIRKVKRWRAVVYMFPLRPMGWAEALQTVAEPADVWHGMWAGSLPALVRLSRKHGGRTIYDSRDVYMHSRDFSRLEWPLRPVLAAAERHWALRVDRVLTVNEPYADLIADQLHVARPAVVLNCPERWTPPVPAPDRIREVTGVGRGTAIALYQGQLTTERGIEQAMDAILAVPDAVLVLLGFGNRERQFRELAASPPYAGKVFVLDAVPPSELLEWSASADVMLMPIQPTTTNHRFTTPQKLWEAIAAGVPVVASDLPGMAVVVEPAEVGVLCDPTRPSSIAEAVRTVIERSPADHASLRRHVLEVAHETYNWESQLATLFGVYAQLGHPPIHSPAATAMADPSSASTSSAVAEGPGAGHTGGPPATPRLQFASAYRPLTPAEAGGTVLVVLDTAWTPDAEERATGLVLLRDVVEAILRERDLYEEASRALDGWAEASDIAGLLAYRDVSFWYGMRLRHWLWLVEHALWLAVVDRLLKEYPGTRALAFGDTTPDPGLLEAARDIAKRDGLTLEIRELGPSGGLFARASARPAAPRAAAERGATVATPAARKGLMGRLRWRLAPPPLERRRREVVARMRAIELDPVKRLLVVQAHPRQRVDTPTGPRYLNVYLGPVVDRLRGTRLEPFEVDIRSTIEDDSAWARLVGSGGPRDLPSDAIRIAGFSVRGGAQKEAVAATVARARALRAPLVVAGVDLGPRLATSIADRTARTHARVLDEVERLRLLIRRLQPAGILLADEYHRQDWMTAALAEGVPVAAIQHGVIYRWHPGYIHRTRPAALRLPGRTYTFGAWERDLLVGESAYLPGEVVVGGSPRLDLVRAEPVDAAAVRAELGVADGDRLLVLSGTWGALDRRFNYPIELANLFREPLRGVHVVVKQHPSEKDEGPYRRIIEGAAFAGGFKPPTLTVVRDIDLYRLLAAADAHLGVHSTVMTEAVFTGTPNLIANRLKAADLLGYALAGVATPVQSSEDIAFALDRPREELLRSAERGRFLMAHFEPGEASERIASDLLAWLA